MIPTAFIDAWFAEAPWQDAAQVEQDLILSRALCEMFGRVQLSESLAFRGGTALNKLYFKPAVRYSEDLDLVQVTAGRIGPILHEMRRALDPWLGSPSWEQNAGSVKLRYSYLASGPTPLRRRVKIEINTREHFAVLDRASAHFGVDNPWFASQVLVPTFGLEELLATKLRALYQRSKGRDLYDLWKALTALGARPDLVVDVFAEYLDRGGVRVSRAEFEANMGRKLRDDAFRSDVRGMLVEDAVFDVDAAAELVLRELIARLPGEPWKGSAGGN